ncbi:MAG: sugar kinase [Eubacteriaceae bacterium]
MKPEFDVITMGEILLRLSAPGNDRLSRGEIFEKHAGGAELNVASGIALLGLRTGIISQVPDNPIGHYIRNEMRFNGVSDDYLLFDSSPEARLGLYYYENGAYPRQPGVFYDRNDTSFQKINPDDLPEDLYTKTRLFHFSGINLALGDEIRESTIEIMKRFKQAGAAISFDVNFRGNLWSGEEARTVIEPLLPMIDFFFCSEDTARLTFGMEGTLKEIQKNFAEQYGIKVIASTKRTVKSPMHHDFTSSIYSAANDSYYEEDPYKNIEVVDRIGSGDAYVAGALYGWLSSHNPRRALEIGNAFSAIKNTIPGDLPSSELEEVERVIELHHQHGGYIPEMSR